MKTFGLVIIVSGKRRIGRLLNALYKPRGAVRLKRKCAEKGKHTEALRLYRIERELSSEFSTLCGSRDWQPRRGDLTLARRFQRREAQYK